MSAINFNPATVQPFGDRQALPKGEYRVVLTGSEIKDVKDKPNCRFIAFQADVIESNPPAPPGSKLHFNVNHVADNPAASRIGLERLSALCYVTIGAAQLQDTQQLHGRPFRVKLDVSSDGKYNDISAYFADDGTPVSKLAAPAAQGYQQAPPPAGNPYAAPAPAGNPYAAPAAVPQAPPPGYAAPAPQQFAQQAPPPAAAAAAPWQQPAAAAAPAATPPPWGGPPPAQGAAGAPPWGAQ